MPNSFMHHVTINGTNFEIQDKEARGDIDELKGSLNQEVGDLKSHFDDLDEVIIQQKNLITEFVSGKYVVSSSLNKIVMVDSDTYNYVKVDAEDIAYFSCTRGFSNNFSFYAKKDGTSLGKITENNRIGTQEHVYSVPTGTEVIYLSSNGLSSDIVVLSGQAPISANDYPVSECPYNTVFKTTIPTLMIDSVGETLDEFAKKTNPPYYQNLRDNITDLAVPYAFFGPASISGSTVTVTGVNGGLQTSQFASNSNLVKIKGNITFTTPNLYWQIAFYHDGRWSYSKQTVIANATDFELSFDAASMVVYNNAEKFFILFNTTTESGVTDYSGTIIINDLIVYETTAFQQFDYYDKEFEPMMQKVFSGIDEAKQSQSGASSAGYIVAPDGTKFIIGMGANNQIITIPIIPSKTLFCGNSLLLGMNTGVSNKSYIYGMCASAPENDYCHKLMATVNAKNPAATYDRIHGAAFEQLGTGDSFATLWATTANIYTGQPMKDSFTSDLDLIVIQLSDNVNTDDRRTAFANNIDAFLSNVRNASPNARILWVYGWFYNGTVANIIENACEKWGAEVLNIRALHTSANEGVSGQSYITGTGGTAIVKDTWITHPGDSGFTAIANAMISALKMT